MKKKDLKKLSLNKKDISQLSLLQLKGGRAGSVEGDCDSQVGLRSVCFCRSNEHNCTSQGHHCDCGTTGNCDDHIES